MELSKAKVTEILQDILGPVLELPLPYTDPEQLVKVTFSVMDQTITLRYTLTEGEPFIVTYRESTERQRLLILLCLREYAKQLFELNQNGSYAWIYENGKTDSFKLFA